MDISLQAYAELTEKRNSITFTLPPAKRQAFVDAINAQFPDAHLPEKREQGVVLRVESDEPKGNATIWTSGSAQVTGALVELEFDFGPTAR
jgi:hypothetical protein